VTVRWTVTEEALTFLWREQGGPPVARVSKAGFGTKLIKRTLAAELKGTVKLEFEPTGLVCRVEAPLPDWQEPG
jgi:two-component sensor histidine kinase